MNQSERGDGEEFGVETVRVGNLRTNEPRDGRLYRILPCITRTHVFDPNVQGEKNLSF